MILKFLFHLFIFHCLIFEDIKREDVDSLQKELLLEALRRENMDFVDMILNIGFDINKFCKRIWLTDKQVIDQNISSTITTNQI